MFKVNALLVIGFILAGCGATPTGTEAAQQAPVDEAVDVQANADNSGLGTISYDEKTRAKPCKKRRRTGSHLYTNSCADPDGGTRRVQQGDWNSVGRYVVTGGGPND